MKKNLLFLIIALVVFAPKLQAQNLLTNSGFETWTGFGANVTPSNWTIVNPQNGTIAQNTTLFNEGTKSCRITANNNGNYAISQTVAVTAGKTYTFQVSYYTENTISGSGRDARINCYFQNGTGTGIPMNKEDSLGLIGPGGNTTTGSLLSGIGSWKTYTYVVVVPTGATRVFISLVALRTATISWDNVSLIETSAPAIYKYTYSGSSGFNYSPSLTGFNYVIGSGPSAIQSFSLKACNLTGSLTITAPENYEISSPISSVFTGTNSISIPQTGGSINPVTLYVRLKSGLAINTYTGNITLTSTGATTQTIPLTGAVSVPPPTITPSVTTLSGFNYTEGSGPSAIQSFTVSISNLTSSLSISAPTNYEISLTSGISFSGVSAINLSYPSGSVATTTIYVRLKAGLYGGSYTGNISLTSGTTSRTVALSGTVTSIPGINLSSSSLSGFSYTLGAGPSNIQSFTVWGSSLTNYIIINAPINFQISTETGTAFSGTGQILLQTIGGIVAPTPIYVRLGSGLPINTYSENLTITSTGFSSKTVVLNGNVTSSIATATENALNNELKIFARNNEIIVEGTANNQVINIYNTVGALVKSVISKGDRLEIPISFSSVYIVRTAGKTVKVIL